MSVVLTHFLTQDITSIIQAEMARQLPFGSVLLSRMCSSVTPKPSIPFTHNLESPEACGHACPKSETERDGSKTILKKSIPVKNMKSINQIPGPKGLQGLPILGTILALHPFTNHTTSKFHLLFRELHAKYGKIVLFPMGKKKSVLLFDPDLIDAAMRDEGRYPHRMALPILESYASRRGADLISLRQGESWYQVRRPLQQGLSSRTIGSALVDHVYCGDDLVMELGRLTNTDGQLNALFLKRLLMQYVLEATAVITFNTRLGILSDNAGSHKENEEFFQNVDEVFLLISKSLYTLPLMKWYRTPAYKRFESAMDNIRSFCKKKILLAREDLKDHQMCDNLLRHLSHDHNMSDEQVTTVMSSILFGGIEMTSQALTWVLWSLGTHEDKQEKLIQEIQSIYNKHNNISVEELQHMPYLKACVKESFRFVFPSVNGSMRIIPSDVILSDYLVPKGVSVLLLIGFP